MGQTQIEGHATKCVISNSQNCQKKKKKEKEKSEKLSCLGRAQENRVTKYGNKVSWMESWYKKRKLGEG